MKNLLLILTVLLCTVSCTKKDTTPTFDWNNQLKTCKSYTYYNTTYYFNSNNSLHVASGTKNYSGTYNINSSTELYTYYYLGGMIPYIINTYKGCYKRNDSIYDIDNNFILKELK